MNIKVKLGKVFRKMRKAKGLSQEEFAHRVGTHRTYIGMIERAEKNITIERCFKIAKALGVPLSKIIKEIEDNG